MDITNKQAIKDFFSAVAENNTEKMLSTFDPDLKIIEAESLPYGGIVKGSENFQDFTRTVYTTWKNTNIQVQQMIAEDAYVVVLATMSAQSKTSGSFFEMDIAEVWTFNSAGKVVEIKPFYFDTHKLVRLHSGDI